MNSVGGGVHRVSVVHTVLCRGAGCRGCLIGRISSLGCTLGSTGVAVAGATARLGGGDQGGRRAGGAAGGGPVCPRGWVVRAVPAGVAGDRGRGVHPERPEPHRNGLRHRRCRVHGGGVAVRLGGGPWVGGVRVPPPGAGPGSRGRPGVEVAGVRGGRGGGAGAGGVRVPAVRGCDRGRGAGLLPRQSRAAGCSGGAGGPGAGRCGRR